MESTKTIVDVVTDPQTHTRSRVTRVLKVLNWWTLGARCLIALQIIQKEVRTNKRIQERRKLAKFGECAGQPLNTCEPNIVTQQPDSISLILKPTLRNAGRVDDPLQQLKSSSTSGSLVKCSLCGSPEHFSLKCPKRKELAPTGASAPPASVPVVPSSASTATAAAAAAARPAASGLGAKTDKYVPVHLRRPPGSMPLSSSSTRDQAEENTLRVLNLSADATEDDLRELFGRFGDIMRPRIVRDRDTQQSRGFAFITFYRRAEAEAAMQRLNGYGYDSQILAVDWAKPREPKPE